MAQGKLKVKGSGGVQKKSKHQKKNHLGPKKGGKKNIAPKKQQKIKEKKLKVHLERSIQSSIEQQLVQKAGPESLSLVKAPETSTSTSAGGKSKQTKK
ncbi:UPF0390 protein zgc136864-like [Clytia hemisphaerica]|uniref:UPF0390 protein zgc136864-like n=1 Tax=Clytia hemisphaerica TaxID=252671 RepID=UPI0034D63B0B